MNSEARALTWEGLVQRVIDLTGKKPGVVRSQLDTAVYNGYLVESGDGSWFARTRE